MDYHELSDRELEILIVGECPEGAMMAYLGRHLGGLARMAKSIYGIEGHAVQDMVGATVLTFCERRKTLTPDYLKRWLYQTLIYHCLNYRRKKRKLDKMGRDLSVITGNGSVSGGYVSILRLDVMIAMEKFRAKDRKLLYNMLVEEKSCEDIARAEGKSVRGMEIKRASLLKRLRTELEDR